MYQFFAIIPLLFSLSAHSKNVSLENISTQAKSYNEIEIKIRLSEKKSPYVYKNSKEYTIFFDFFDTDTKIEKVEIPKKARSLIKDLKLKKTNNKLRLIAKLDSLFKHSIITNNKEIIITLSKVQEFKVNLDTKISGVDFFKQDENSSKLGLKIDGKIYKSMIEGTQYKDKMVYKLKNIGVREQFIKKYNVQDFTTPVDHIKIYQVNSDSYVEIIFNKFFFISEDIIDGVLVFNISRDQDVSEIAREVNVDSTNFIGEKISINLQNVDVRAVIKKLSEFSGFNIIASDSVKGSISIKLNEIPWDEALDIISRIKGFVVKKSGNVYFMSTLEEFSTSMSIAESLKSNDVKLKPLEYEYVKLKYAKATEMISLISSSSSSSSSPVVTTTGFADTSSNSNSSGTGGLLSSRGVINADPRTNGILILDTKDNIFNMKKLISKLDQPTKQVLIEIHIVETSDNLSDEFMVRIDDVSGSSGRIGSGTVLGSRTQSSSATESSTTTSSTADDTATPTVAAEPSPDSVGGTGSSIAQGWGGLTHNTAAINPYVILKSSKILLNLELAAAESENRAKTLAKPRIITLDQKPATFKYGSNVKIKSSDASGSVGTVVSEEFQSFTLDIKVTPQINDDENVTLELSISDDSPVVGTQAETKTIDTNVEIKSGDTFMIGGIYKSIGEEKNYNIPILSKIPLIGELFKGYYNKSEKREYIVFVTPHIV